MRLAILVLMLLSGTQVFSQKVSHYNIDLTIHPSEKTIDVNLMMEILNGGNASDSVTFILNKNALIHSFAINGKKSDYKFDPSGKVVNRYLSDGRALSFLTTSRFNKSNVSIRYTCAMGDLKANASSFADQWIEFGQYTSWYPINFNYGEITALLTIHAPKEFEISGSGVVSKEGNTWKMNQSIPTQDLVVIASNAMKTKSSKRSGKVISLKYTALSDSRADSIANGVFAAYDLFSGYFGKVDGSDLTIAVNPLKDRASYARKGFISIQIGSISNFQIEKIIAHEIGHFWWNNASADSWEDWLNESFAEYSTLLFVKERYGVTAYNEELVAFQKSAADRPALRGFDRSSSNASTMLYRKGPVILAAFSDRFGNDVVLKLFREVKSRNIKTTQDLLTLIATTVSPEASDWLSEALSK